MKGCAVLPSVRRPPHLSFPGKISEMMNSPCQILSSLRSTAAYLISASRLLWKIENGGHVWSIGTKWKIEMRQESPWRTERRQHGDRSVFHLWCDSKRASGWRVGIASTIMPGVGRWGKGLRRDRLNYTSARDKRVTMETEIGTIRNPSRCNAVPLKLEAQRPGRAQAFGCRRITPPFVSLWTYHLYCSV